MTITTDLDIARSTLEWHLDHFIMRDIIEKQWDSKNRVTLTLVRPERTVKLLREIRPSTPDRFVDRFIRFTDQLLEREEEQNG